MTEQEKYYARKNQEAKEWERSKQEFIRLLPIMVGVLLCFCFPHFALFVLACVVDSSSSSTVDSRYIIISNIEILPISK